MVSGSQCVGVRSSGRLPDRAVVMPETSVALRAAEWCVSGDVDVAAAKAASPLKNCS
jgi:hypothetical protein